MIRTFSRDSPNACATTHRGPTDYTEYATFTPVPRADTCGPHKTHCSFTHSFESSCLFGGDRGNDVVTCGFCHDDSRAYLTACCRSLYLFLLYVDRSRGTPIGLAKKMCFYSLISKRFSAPVVITHVFVFYDYVNLVNYMLFKA